MAASKNTLLPTDFIGIGGGCAEQSALLLNHGFMSRAQVDPKDNGVSAVDPRERGIQLLRSFTRVHDVDVK